MNKIFTAKTVEEAKELAIAEFAVDSSRIVFEIVEEPKKSLFGKTKGEAKISASYEETKTDIATAYIRSVLSKMEVTDVEFKINEIDGGANIEIISSQSEIFIGRRGEILDSIQYLTSLVCNKADKEYYRISLDANGYRDKRKSQLEALAEKISKSVIRSGRSSVLEPMNPYERRIIHAKVSEIEGVSSRSTGEDPYRKVIISSTNRRFEKKDDFKGKKNNNNNNNNNNGGGFNKKPAAKPKSFDIKTSFEKDYKKPRPEDNLSSGLYSKIEF